MDSKKPHQFALNIYYEDTDISGHVYHANYLKFLERARTEYLKSCGFLLKTLLQEGLQFVVSEVTVKYYKPATLNDRIIVKTQLLKITGARMLFNQSIFNVLDESKILCQGQVTTGCLDLDFKPTRFPEKIKKELK